MVDDDGGTYDDLIDSQNAFNFFKTLQPENRPLVVPTPFPGLNSACRGFGARVGLALGWYVIIGGDTGQGKSKLALQLAVEAHKRRHRTGIVQLEMSWLETQARLYSQIAGIEASRLEPGEKYDPSAHDEFKAWRAKHVSETGGIPFYGITNMNPEVRAVMALMRRWLDSGVEVFVVDYLQLLESEDGAGSVREVQKISKSLRDFAHKYGVLVIALSQYNNEGGNDRERSPHVGHLYGGRRISQDSDLTLLLDHSRYERDIARPYIARSFLMVPKNRNGPSGFEIPIEWDDRYLTARQGFPDEQYNWPSHKKTRGR